MYPGYELYWSAVLADPDGPLPVTSRPATKGEIAYARWAERATHVVLSRTLERAARTNTRIVRDVDAIRRLKQQPGKDIRAVGGAALVGTLMNHGLVDELEILSNGVDRLHEGWLGVSWLQAYSGLREYLAPKTQVT